MELNSNAIISSKFRNNSFDNNVFKKKKPQQNLYDMKSEMGGNTNIDGKFKIPINDAKFTGKTVPSCKTFSLRQVSSCSQAKPTSFREILKKFNICQSKKTGNKENKNASWQRNRNITLESILSQSEPIKSKSSFASNNSSNSSTFSLNSNKYPSLDGLMSFREKLLLFSQSSSSTSDDSFNSFVTLDSQMTQDEFVPYQNTRIQTDSFNKLLNDPLHFSPESLENKMNRNKRLKQNDLTYARCVDILSRSRPISSTPSNGQSQNIGRQNSINFEEYTNSQNVMNVCNADLDNENVLPSQQRIQSNDINSEKININSCPIIIFDNTIIREKDINHANSMINSYMNNENISTDNCNKLLSTKQNCQVASQNQIISSHLAYNNSNNYAQDIFVDSEMFQMTNEANNHELCIDNNIFFVNKSQDVLRQKRNVGLNPETQEPENNNCTGTDTFINEDNSFENDINDMNSRNSVEDLLLITSEIQNCSDSQNQLISISQIEENNNIDQLQNENDEVLSKYISEQAYDTYLVYRNFQKSNDITLVKGRFRNILEEESTCCRNPNEPYIYLNDDTFLACKSHILNKIAEGTELQNENINTLKKYLNQKDNRLSKAQKLIQEGVDSLRKDKSLKYINYIEHELTEEEAEERAFKISFSIIKRLHHNLKLKAPLKILANRGHTTFFIDRLMTKPGCYGTRIISENNRRQFRRFKQIMFLLGKVMELMETRTTCAKRELYYQHRYIFPTMRQVYDVVNDVSLLLNMLPYEFGITSTSKGLVYGNLKLTLKDKSIIDCNIGCGINLPDNSNHILQAESKAAFILIVEKDTIFKKLISEGLPNKLMRPFILITGKGFPDVETRLFIRKILSFLQIPGFVMTDPNPYGIEIMLTYRFGARGTCYFSEYLALPNIRWVGVFPSEIYSSKIRTQPLSQSDNKKIKCLLKRPYIDAVPRIKEELLILVEMKKKADIENIAESPLYLSDNYFPNKFCCHDYI